MRSEIERKGVCVCVCAALRNLQLYFRLSSVVESGRLWGAELLTALDLLGVE